ncbi:hypothetical protein [Methanolobus sp.]|uniref:hypothetical protein n=1 Tax=Methanolobus sp. TaxID=1874737 RepID=UPI0025F711A4|nr:hypothetical protein [Methanolobus sp.]
MSNAFKLPRRSIRAGLAVMLVGASIAFTATQTPCSEILTLTGSVVAYYFATGDGDNGA